MSKVQRSRLLNRARTAAWSPTPPRLNRWLTQPTEGTARYRDQPNKIKHTGAGFRGLNPNRRGGLFRGAFKFGGRRAATSPGAADARRSSPGGLRHSTPAPPGAALLAAGRRPGGAEGGPPAPPRRLRSDAAAAARLSHLAFRSSRRPFSFLNSLICWERRLAVGASASSSLRKKGGKKKGNTPRALLEGGSPPAPNSRVFFG